jgi:hypothetical protein
MMYTDISDLFLIQSVPVCPGTTIYELVVNLRNPRAGGTCGAKVCVNTNCTTVNSIPYSSGWVEIPVGPIAVTGMVRIYILLYTVKGYGCLLDWVTLNAT